MKSCGIKNFKVYKLENSLIIFKPKKALHDVYQDATVLNIAHHTQNTWQENRSFEEILDNTVQGKVVEEMFENYIEAKNSGIKYMSYDVFRDDNYSKHAPFDGFLYDTRSPFLDEGIVRVTEDVNKHNYGKLKDETFAWLTSHHVYTVEIKSSKIPHKDYPHQKNLDFNSWEYQKGIVNNLRKRDFFVYPKYNRKNGRSIHDFSDYINYVQQLNITFKGDFITGLLDEERIGKCDIYTRIFVDRKHSDHLIAYMLGYVLKDSFFEKPHIINMPGKKSGNAVYFAFPISKAHHIDTLMMDGVLW
ncbi:MAG: hypothetical protein L0F95_02830 [Lactococcus sp.]|jgi:hypothetical protein|nr:hypothetical protein [Lactococcus sp.]MBR6894925.1 hypothetical protein [Lactococcus sp.]MDN5409257.1 hypothetical protein [Lactococcus sp.]MDN5411334.1 hypothetical protein [Lactococcus sp.]MDN5436394.1 hypothetical protein [Lactococcus sp.]MDN5461156.1 hypothetical protein [Lactococcus sp.]